MKVAFPRFSLVASLTLLSASVSGCVAYQPAPIDIGQLSVSAHRAIALPSDSHGLLETALAHDPALQAARARLIAAEAAVRSSKNLPPLSLNLTAEYSRDADAQRPWLYGGSIGIPLDLGGRRDARVTSAELAVLRARYDVGEAAWKVRQTVMQALSDLHTSRQQIDAIQGLLDQRNHLAALINKRLAAGEDAHSQGLLAQLDASGLIDGLLQARAKHAQAQASLARTLDVPVTDMELDIDLNPPPVDPLSAARLTGLSNQALYTRADVLNAVVDYDVAENDLRNAVANQYPDINIGPGYTWERGAVKLPLTASFTLPPLDGNRANIHQAEAARTAAGKALEDQVKSTLAAIQQVALTYESDRAIADKVRKTDMPLAEDLASRSSRLTQAGETDQTENLAVQIAAAQTRLTLFLAEQATLDDRLNLEDTLHQSLDPAENEILRAAVQPQEVKK
ncbi:MAG: TolC family protein [Asticcacaulis sp.]|uniref:TolC family protein n=1 Tax=Asticcacaulis sp. TaxID=1872648 RepID=UPI0039E52FAB